MLDVTCKQSCKANSIGKYYTEMMKTLTDYYYPNNVNYIMRRFKKQYIKSLKRNRMHIT